MHISSVKLWDDIGFTEGCIEIPEYVSAGYDGETAFGVPVYAEESLMVPRDRLFTEMRLSVPFNQVRNANYLEAVFVSSDNDPSPFHVFGWIEDVIDTSSGEVPFCTVKWHMDPWMTYMPMYAFGYGHVQRRPNTGDILTPYPVQGYQYISRPSCLSSWDLCPVLEVEDTKVSWIVISRAMTESESSTESGEGIRYYFFPVRTGYETGGSQGLSPIYIRNGTEVLPSFPGSEAFNGDFLSYMPFDPNNVVSAWVSPIPPTGGETIVYREGAVQVISGADGVTVSSGTVSETTYAWFVYDQAMYIGTSDAGERYWSEGDFEVSEGRPDLSVWASELNELRVMAWDGSSLGSIPYGMWPSKYRTRLLLSATECMVEIRFDTRDRTNEGADPNFSDARGRGLLFTYPCPSLDISTNSWSSYVHSGQRQYDISMRDEQSLKTGVQSISSGAVSSGIVGGLGNMGALAGALVGGVGGAIGMGSELLYFNDAMQAHEDRVHANQANGILTAGAGFDTAFFGTQGFALERWTMDTYSYQLALNQRSLLGISVDEETADCSTLIRSGGFLRISTMVVTGAAPLWAKRWVKDRFSKGVRLKEV